MKILIVDDELVSRRKMEKIMESIGEVTSTDLGAYAISIFKNALDSGSPFDVVTLDIFMPQIDGLQVLYEMRKMEENRQIPKEKKARIIMVTSKKDKATVITAAQAGCNDYVVKPFDKLTIHKKLGTILV